VNRFVLIGFVMIVCTLFVVPSNGYAQMTKRILAFESVRDTVMPEFTFVADTSEAARILTRALSATLTRTDAAMSMLSQAGMFLGVRYRYGGISPKRGFDCSGFVQYVFAKTGIQLPRTAHEMAGSREKLESDIAKLLPGDLLFFADPRNRRRIDHVAIYAGNFRVIHATKHRGVKFDSIGSTRGRWLSRHFVGARLIAPRLAPPVTPSLTPPPANQASVLQF
jgi:cell wall-associated NlpC family hydrolase